MRFATHKSIDRRRRSAASSLEVLVAFTLLSSVLSLSIPLVVRHGRLLSSQRDYRIALDELTNQLDHLTSLSQQDLSATLQSLTPSSQAADRLPNVILESKLVPGDIGMRLVLHILWGTPEMRRRSIIMTGWIFPDRSPPAGEAAEDDAS